MGQAMANILWTKNCDTTTSWTKNSLTLWHCALWHYGRKTLLTAVASPAFEWSYMHLSLDQHIWVTLWLKSLSQQTNHIYVEFAFNSIYQATMVMMFKEAHWSSNWDLSRDKWFVTNRILLKIVMFSSLGEEAHCMRWERDLTRHNCDQISLSSCNHCQIHNLVTTTLAPSTVLTLNTLNQGPTSTRYSNQTRIFSYYSNPTRKFLKNDRVASSMYSSHVRKIVARPASQNYSLIDTDNILLFLV